MPTLFCIVDIVTFALVIFDFSWSINFFWQFYFDRIFLTKCYWQNFVNKFCIGNIFLTIFFGQSGGVLTAPRPHHVTAHAPLTHEAGRTRAAAEACGRVLAFNDSGQVGTRDGLTYCTLRHFLISVPARHISEGAAPCPYCLAPCPNN